MDIYHERFVDICRSPKLESEKQAMAIHGQPPVSSGYVKVVAVAPAAAPATKRMR